MAQLSANPLFKSWEEFGWFVRNTANRGCYLREWLVPHRPEGCEDLLQNLQQGLLPTGGDVVLGQLQERKAVFALAPHVLRIRRNHTENIQMYN